MENFIFKNANRALINEYVYKINGHNLELYNRDRYKQN